MTDAQTLPSPTAFTAVLSLVGIATAYFSDTQLYEYMSNNERLVREKKPKVPLLNTGLWRYSRHPN